MNEPTKNQIISKLGTLQFANAELAGENVLLRNLAAEQRQEIADLKAKIVELSAKVTLTADETENLPSNPYANGGATH